MLISPYHFTDVTRLRALLHRTGAVISRSAAVAFIHPLQFVPNDIHFYVLPSGFPAVLKYIEDHGYMIDPYDQATLDYFRQNIIVLRLVHPISHKSINVTTSADNHVVVLWLRMDLEKTWPHSHQHAELSVKIYQSWIYSPSQSIPASSIRK
jgi:hypothetical protein